MKTTQAYFLSAIVVVSLFIFGISVALILDSDFGRNEVKTISINDGAVELSGLLYRPRSASIDNSCPAVVVAHGISGSKEMMSSIALELSRRGFVTLCLDLFGHGKSGGTVEDGGKDASFGVVAAVQYMKSQTYVNSSRIGLVGHSLGGGAVRATVAQDNQVDALVLIAGGLGDFVESPGYGEFNSTFPKNLLVIVGKYDVLFNLAELGTQELPSVFGAQQEVIPGTIYGSFLSQNARKFIVPHTTHLFEPFDPTVISEIVSWMENSLIAPGSSQRESAKNLIYIERELAIIVGLLGLFGIVFLIFLPVSEVAKQKTFKTVPENDSAPRFWKAYTLWGALNLALFLPMLAAGLLIPFPPLLFGGSIAWWMLAVGLSGLLLIATKYMKFRGEIGLKETLKEALDKRYVVVALTIFLVLLATTILIEETLNFNFRIITPIFRSLTSPRRILAFFSFLPFFLPYFLGEGLYLHETCRLKRQQNQGTFADLREYGVTTIGKIAPFLAVISLQYFPMLMFNVWIFPSYAGFVFEFLWLIVPIFIITTTCSWWFYRNTKKIGIGAIFNALAMAWVASTVFPF